MCGAGINVLSNTFTENSPIVHTANGGAISLECDFVSSGASLIAGGASNVISVEPFQTTWISEYSDDVHGYTHVHKVHRYAAAVKDNTFTRNAAG